MTTRNLLLILSDEHNPKMLGCYGHDLVRTPNIDRLAEKGTRFTAAYTNSPICIPARAALATGRPVHETGYWDNAMPYDGRVEGWGHRLQREGLKVEAIGKLHYRNSDDVNGFDRQIEPMHVMDGIGQVWGSVRDPLPPSRPARMLGDIGPGESSYNRYDRLIADRTKEWLHRAAGEDEPWALQVGFVAPHFPLTVPRRWYDLYPLDRLPDRKLDPAKGFTRHHWIQRMDDFQQVDRNLTPEARRMATAAYFGLCSYVDFLIGEILDTLEATGLDASTCVIYTSDHGDNVGARGLWGKSNMYEESAGIPLVMAGHGVPEGAACETPVSLLDIYPTVMEATGLTADEERLPGQSLFDLAAADYDDERIVFSEYHAAASPSGAFMVRRGSHKFIYYVGYEPELFDLAADPEETRNIAGDKPELALECEEILRGICDPEGIDRQAKDDQNALTDRFGGAEAAFGKGTPGATPVPV